MAALCVLLGSGWILTQGWPSEMAWPLAACLHFILIGVAAAAVAAARGELKRPTVRRYALICVAGTGLFALPAAVLHLAAGKVEEFTSAAVFCAVPLMTVLASLVFDTGGDSARLRGFMVPSLLGLGGAVFLFPLENPGSLRRWLYLGTVLACGVAVSLAGVWMHRLMQGAGVAAAVAVIGLGNAAALAAAGLSVGGVAMGWKAVGAEILRGAVLDLPEVWLMVWLTREVIPTRLAARFLLVPAVTVLEGFAIERGGLDAKAGLALALLGLALLLGGGVTLLVADKPEELPGLGLR